LPAFEEKEKSPDPCRLVRQVKLFDGYRNGNPGFFDPCRLVRQVKLFDGYRTGTSPSSTPAGLSGR
jgi:hypothetical protein